MVLFVSRLLHNTSHTRVYHITTSLCDWQRGIYMIYNMGSPGLHLPYLIAQEDIHNIGVLSCYYRMC